MERRAGQGKMRGGEPLASQSALMRECGATAFSAGRDCIYVPQRA